jgi:hypothetical protein
MHRRSARAARVSKSRFPRDSQPRSRPITCDSFSFCASISAAPATPRATPRARSAPRARDPAHTSLAPPLTGPGILGVVVFTPTPDSVALGKSDPRLERFKPLPVFPLDSWSPLWYNLSRRRRAAANRLPFSDIFLFLA